MSKNAVLAFHPGQPLPLVFKAPGRLFKITDRLAPITEHVYARRLLSMFAASMLKLNQSNRWFYVDEEFRYRYDACHPDISRFFTVTIYGQNTESERPVPWQRTFDGRIQGELRFLFCPACGTETAAIGYLIGSGGRHIECDQCLSGQYTQIWPKREGRRRERNL